MSKNFAINERFGLKYDIVAYNIFNHPSFDIPSNNVDFNPFFANPPIYGFTGFQRAFRAQERTPVPDWQPRCSTAHRRQSALHQMALHLTF